MSHLQFPSLLTTTALIEAGTGLVLVVSPSLVVMLLLGSSLNEPVALSIARVAGVALLTLGVACWLARDDWESGAAKGLVGAMTLYNAGVAIVLVYAGTALGLSSIGLWPAVLLHAGMAGWCIKCLRS